MSNPNQHPLYFLIINYHSSHLITRLISSIKSSDNDYQIVIVNNSPEDNPIQELKSSQIQVLEAKANLGFGKGCNLGLKWIYKQDPQALVWLVNPDAYLLQNSFKDALNFLTEHPEISILGTEVYEPTGKIWFGWGKFEKTTGKIVVVEDSLNYQNQPYHLTEWVTGCSLIINLKKFLECPYFDPDYFLYYEDFDFCQRYAKQGHLVAITNQIYILHEPSSITLKYGYLRLIHNIYSYLLSLEKHTHKFMLWGRFIRMIFMALILLPIKPQFALAKLQGIFMYCQRLINLLLTQGNNAKNFS